MRNTLLISRRFSFSSLGVAWLISRVLKYYLYGIHAFGFHWNSDPTFLSRVKFVFGTVIGMETVLFLVAAAIVDSFVWPILFREAVHECLAIEE